MQTSPDLWLFFLMVLGVIALPGMDMALVGASTLSSGVRGGIAALLGVIAGGAVHVVVAVSGVAAFLAFWPAAFNLLLVLGTAYMLHVGWTLMRAQPQLLAFEVPAIGLQGGWPLFRKGMLTCLVNPKAYVFMLAIFPAFLRPDQATAAQAVRLGLVIALVQGGSTAQSWRCSAGFGVRLAWAPAPSAGWRAARA